MRARLPLLVLPALTLCVAPGCGGYEPELELELELEDGERAPSIVNGQSDHGHPAVGVLYLKGQAGCTATLIGKRTVLTAAHCVTGSTSAPYQLFANIGFALGPGRQLYSAASVAVHPGYGSQNADVAVVRLGQPIASVTPMPVATTAPKVGEAVILVGFGITADGASSTFGTKRRATNSIGKLSATEMVFYGAPGGKGNICNGDSKGNICNGDSGGPAFAVRGGREVLVGVHSWGEGACGIAEHDQRVDAYRGWIAQQAGADLYQVPTQPSPGPNITPGTKPTPNPPAQPPQVSFSSPGPNAQLGPSFTAAVKASCADGIARVELYVDGAKVQQRSARPFVFQVGGLAAGHHNLRAVAVSTAKLRASTLIGVTVLSQQPAAPATPGPGGPLPPAGADADLAVVGSCSLGGGGSAPPLGLLLLGLLWCARRRRG
jgi:hypothetical protein